MGLCYFVVKLTVLASFLQSELQILVSEVQAQESDMRMPCRYSMYD